MATTQSEKPVSQQVQEGIANMFSTEDAPKTLRVRSIKPSSNPSAKSVALTTDQRIDHLARKTKWMLNQIKKENKEAMSSMSPVEVNVFLNEHTDRIMRKNASPKGRRRRVKVKKKGHKSFRGRPSYSPTRKGSSSKR